MGVWLCACDQFQTSILRLAFDHALVKRVVAADQSV